MGSSKRERVRKGLDLLKDGLQPFVERELRTRLGKGWVDDVSSRVRLSLDKEGSILWDIQGLLKSMIDNWRSVFSHRLGHGERAYIGELLEARNDWAHERPFSSDDVYRVLDTSQRLLQAIPTAAGQAEDLGKLKVDLQREVFREQARNKTRYQLTLEGVPKAGLKPWRELVTPHPDVASGKYMQAEFAADLAQVQHGEASDEYQDPTEFYRRTYITAGLRELLTGALERLSGSGGDPVVELQTNFGGGKTHSMLALFHLFSGAPTSQLEGMEPLLQDVGLKTAPKAHRAVLVGTAWGPGEILLKEDGTQVRTIWGELAWQLGGREGYEMVASLDEQGVSPGDTLLSQLFIRFSPCLVLIDEWVAYARQIVGKDDLPSGDFEAQTTFAQVLTQAAKRAKNTLVVASIPQSKIEIGGHNGQLCLDVLKNAFRRVARPWRPATGQEGFEIVRRRLFEQISGKENFAARDAVVNAFTKMYRSGAGQFPSQCSETTYRDELRGAYPIHPELFHRLYDDWSTLDRFQRTRGVLRLMAKVIHRLWLNQEASLLILPASVPLDDPAVKSELTHYLPDVWEPIISQDVDGPDSLPIELDQGNPTFGRYSACRRVARTLYVGTAPGSTNEKNPGIGDQQILLGCVQPGETVATFGDALRRLGDRGRYTHQDGNRYWLSTRPNLNRTADDRAAALLREPEELHQEIVGRIQKERARGDFAAVHACPESTADIPDEPTARLVILSPRYPHRRKQKETEALKAAQEFLENRGGSPRLNRNTLVFLAPDQKELDSLLEATAQFLAWKSILDDEKKLNLDVFQREQAKARKEDSDRTVDLRISGTWCHLLVSLQTEATAEVSWDQLKVSGSDPLAKRASAKLLLEEMLLPALGGERLRMTLDRYLWTERDHVSFRELSEWFPRYLYLPRLVSRDTLEEAVRDGASQLLIDDTFAVAQGFDEAQNRYIGLRVGGAPKVIDSQTLVVKPEVARRHHDEETAKVTVATGASVSGSLGTTSSTRDGDQGTGGGASPAPAQETKLRTFVGSVPLNGDRVGREAGRVAEEVLQHLSTLPNAEVEITLEIHVRAPEGIGKDVVRTVTENASALGFTHASFED